MIKHLVLVSNINSFSLGILGVHQSNTPIECLDCYKGELALSVGTGHSEIRFWNTRDVKEILEGTKEARQQVKGSTKKKKLTGKDRKTTFYSGFGENLDDKIELKDQHHSSEDEEIEKQGPNSSDSLSEDDLGQPEPSTSELESDHKTIKRPVSPKAGNSAGKKRRRKKNFKPLL